MVSNLGLSPAAIHLAPVSFYSIYLYRIIIQTIQYVLLRGVPTVRPKL